LTAKKLIGVAIAGAFTLGLAAPAFAEGDPAPEPAKKCNSGNGNGSEVPGDDCDPGNSGSHNNGKD
jgi:hypothetical protein